MELNKVFRMGLVAGNGLNSEELSGELNYRIKTKYVLT